MKATEQYFAVVLYVSGSFVIKMKFSIFNLVWS